MIIFEMPAGGPWLKGVPPLRVNVKKLGFKANIWH